MGKGARSTEARQLQDSSEPLVSSGLAAFIRCDSSRPNGLARPASVGNTSDHCGSGAECPHAAVGGANGPRVTFAVGARALDGIDWTGSGTAPRARVIAGAWTNRISLSSEDAAC